MPNIRGLDPAPILIVSLNQGRATAYGPHATVSLQGHLITLRARSEKVIATVDFSREKPRVKADLTAIDGDTVTPVNALLRPYGKVKAYWRNPGEYRWHPNDGPASAPQGAPAPVAAPQAPITPPVAPSALSLSKANLAPAAVVEQRPTVSIRPVAGGGSGVTIIGTETRFDGKKTPVIRELTKTYSQVGEVLLPHHDVKTLEIAWKLRAAGRPAGVRITGPAGTAKTRLAEQFAFSKGVPFLIVEGQSIQTAADWYGGFVPTAGGFEWVWSDFALALRRGEPMVILIDELNRPENERALNGLMGLMAWTAMTKPVGAPEALTLAPGILIMATINEGPEYVGTVEIDAAVNDRFPWGVRMDYSPENIETRVLIQQAPGIDRDIAKKLVRIAATQRAKRDDDTLYPSHNVLSTRTLIEVASAIVVAGADPVDAIWSAIRGRFIVEDEPALSVLIEAQFGANPESLDTLADDDDIEAMLASIQE